MITDFLPIVLFIYVYDHRGFAAGTRVLIFTTIVMIFVAYIKEKRVPILPIYVALLTSVFGILTLDTMNPKYIQMRDTFYDATFAVLLYLSLKYRNRLVLKDMFGHVFTKLNDREWITITWSWIIHFAVLSISNELIRRYFKHFWLDYKGMVIFITMLHGVALIYYYRRKL